MLIGHLPAGYLLAAPALDRLPVSASRRRLVLGTTLAASVAPDLDLLYFYTLGGDVHHHALPLHWPAFWLGATLVGLGASAALRNRLVALGSLAAGAGALVHLALDSVAGEVRWLAPYSEASLTLVEVPARFDSWVWSMVLHWTFGAEFLFAIAAYAYWRLRRRAAPGIG